MSAAALEIDLLSDDAALPEAAPLALGWPQPPLALAPPNEPLGGVALAVPGEVGGVGRLGFGVAAPQELRERRRGIAAGLPDSAGMSRLSGIAPSGPLNSSCRCKSAAADR